jgi:hypothetical protein
MNLLMAKQEVLGFNYLLHLVPFFDMLMHVESPRVSSSSRIEEHDAEAGERFSRSTYRGRDWLRRPRDMKQQQKTRGIKRRMSFSCRSVAPPCLDSPLSMARAPLSR